MFVITAISGALALSTGSFRIRPAGVTGRTASVMLSVGSDLLRECSKEERSLERIGTLVSELSTTAAVTNSKAKRAIIGDWRLVFAGDAAALAPFTSGEVRPPLGVLEDLFCRFEKGSSMKVIEVERRIGPFGNAKRSLVGKYSVASSGTDKTERLRFKYLWMDDANGREAEPPTKNAIEAVVSTSGSILILRVGVDEARNTSIDAIPTDSLLVWTKLRARELDRELDNLGLKKEEVVQS